MTLRSCTSTPDLFDSFLAAPPKNEVLDRIGGLLDWDALRRVMEKAYTPGKGAEGYDPVIIFKLLILQRLYQLSDGDAVWMAADSLTFRKFLGLGAAALVPDDTTLVVFRRRMREAGLLDELFAEVQVQLEARGVGVREGAIKIVDATIIEAAVRPPRKPRAESAEGKQDGAPTPEAKPPLDPDADFTVKNGHPHYGYKLHLAQDRETGLITDHVVTAASVHDSQVFDDLIDGTEGEVMADKAYDSKARRRALRNAGTTCSIMKKAQRGKPLSKWWKGRNRSIARVRGFIEGSNGRFKRFLGCGRAIYIGLERTFLQMTFGVMAFNLTRAAALLQGRCA
jgi:IS5 family transposase